MKKIISISLVVQLALVVSFLWFSLCADQVMDKSGIGDQAKWESFNNLAGFAFYGFGFLWLSVVFIVLLSKSFGFVAAQRAIGFPPIALILGWFLLLFF
jgi:hypothetical protein